MTLYCSNSTFAATLAQTLVNRGLGFTFYKSSGNVHGEYAFHTLDDRTTDTIRTLAADWGVSLYEIEDKDQPSRD